MHPRRAAGIQPRQQPPFVPLAQRMLGGSDRFAVLPVGQVVTRAAGAVAQRAQRPRYRGRTNAPAVLAQQVGQVGQRPDRHRGAVLQRGARERPLQQVAGRRVEGRGAAGARPVGQSVAPFGQESPSPHPDPLGAAPAGTGSLLHAPAVGQHQQRVRPVPDARVGVGPGQPLQALRVFGQIEHGGEPPARRTGFPAPQLLSIRLARRAKDGSC
jgi:hypothetical protein